MVTYSSHAVGVMYSDQLVEKSQHINVITEQAGAIQVLEQFR